MIKPNFRRLLQIAHLILKMAATRITFYLRMTRSLTAPVYLVYEPTTKCNLTCDHCSVTLRKERGDKGANCLAESYNEVLKSVQPLRWVKLQGMGEPFLNPSIIEMIRTANEERVPVRITTNGTALSVRSYASLKTCVISELFVSIDHSDPAILPRLRGGAKLERITETFVRLRQLRDAFECVSQLMIWAVITTRNLEQIQPLVALAKQLDADAIWFQCQLGTFGDKSLQSKIASLSVPSSEQHLRESILKATKAEGYPNAYLYTGDRYSKARPCRWPWYGPYVTVNGDVCPCCVMPEPDVFSFGNINMMPLPKIWNSPKYFEFRTMHRQHQIPDFCRNCYTDIEV